MLKEIAELEFFQHLYIIADALDECPKQDEYQARVELLTLIADIQSSKSSRLHILVTSWQEPDIERALEPLVTLPKIWIQGAQVMLDIQQYIEGQLDEDPKLKRWTSDVKTSIQDAILEKTDGM